MARTKRPKPDMTAEMKRKIFAKQHVLDRAEEDRKHEEAMAKERETKQLARDRRMEVYKRMHEAQQEEERKLSEKLSAFLLTPSPTNPKMTSISAPKAETTTVGGRAYETCEVEIVPRKPDPQTVFQVEVVPRAPDADDPPEAPLPAEPVNPFDWSAIIRAKIKSEGWPCYSLGKTCGVDPAVIQRFMNGQRSIRLETAEKLCGVLGLFLVPRATDGAEE